jgi:hypothetical protein
VRYSERIVSVLLCCLGWAAVSTPVTNEIQITPTGVSTSQATFGRHTFHFAITTVHLKSSEPQFPVETSFTNEVSVIARLTIEFSDGTPVYVQRSTFSDLYNPRKASLAIENEKQGLYVLTIDGGDGTDRAERYQVRLYFRGDKVYRRVVYDPIFGKSPAEETTYHKGATLD